MVARFSWLAPSVVPRHRTIRGLVVRVRVDCRLGNFVSVASQEAPQRLGVALPLIPVAGVEHHLHQSDLLGEVVKLLCQFDKFVARAVVVEAIRRRGGAFHVPGFRVATVQMHEREFGEGDVRPAARHSCSTGSDHDHVRATVPAVGADHGLTHLSIIRLATHRCGGSFGARLSDAPVGSARRPGSASLPPSFLSSSPATVGSARPRAVKETSARAVRPAAAGEDTAGRALTARGCGLQSRTR